MNILSTNGSIVHAETKKSIEITINEINVKHELKQANHYNYNCVNCMEYMYNVAYKLIVHVHVHVHVVLGFLFFIHVHVA